MTENTNQTDELLKKLKVLEKKQDQFAEEIYQLRKEIGRLKNVESEQAHSERNIAAEQRQMQSESTEIQDFVKKNSELSDDTETDQIMQKYIRKQKDPEEASNIEKFICENLINKIGIAITIIGVSIGVKYSIDHELISPLARVLLGYIAGLTLLFLGIRLKAKYENYSAVLVSGSMAILYFMTYAAYTYYGLLPQFAAFALMVLITVFTVGAALQYDRMVIALIGLVGAYAIPFLLSNDSSNATILFSYVAIINTGILVIAVKKYWEPLYYASFVLTWLIYFSWFITTYKADSDFGLAFAFLGIFFVIFYLTFLAYKVAKDTQFDIPDIPLLLANTAIFYGIGYILLSSQKDWKSSLGLFTLFNALIHCSVALMLYFRKHKDKNLFYFITGLALVFVTIAVPVQLDGNWVTMLWAGEMALLFWIGRTQKVAVYEILSYPIMVLTFFSLIHSWSVGYFHPISEHSTTTMLPLFNEYFLTSLLVALSFGFIHTMNSKEQFTSSIADREDFLRFASLAIPSILLLTTYFSFRNEIAFYWDHLHFDAVVKARGSWSKYYTDFYCTDLLYLKTIWIINYSLLFFSILSFLNIHLIKNRSFGLVNLFLNLVITAVFITVGLFFLEKFGPNLANAATLNDQHSFFNVLIRYISFGFLALMLFACYRYIRQDFLKRDDYRMEFDLVLFTSIICVASSELINWMNIAGSAESYKLGLSILWGVYSLLIVSLGIWKKKKYLRIGAIALFTATLIKLFFYDLSTLDTISKTIVFVSLGILLLIISFIYNKYKNIISD